MILLKKPGNITSVDARHNNFSVNGGKYFRGLTKCVIKR